MAEFFTEARRRLLDPVSPSPTVPPSARSSTTARIATGWWTPTEFRNGGSGIATGVIVIDSIRISPRCYGSRRAGCRGTNSVAQVAARTTLGHARRGRPVVSKASGRCRSSATSAPVTTRPIRIVSSVATGEGSLSNPSWW